MFGDDETTTRVAPRPPQGPPKVGVAGRTLLPIGRVGVASPQDGPEAKSLGGDQMPPWAIDSIRSAGGQPSRFVVRNGMVMSAHPGVSPEDQEWADAKLKARGEWHPEPGPSVPASADAVAPTQSAAASGPAMAPDPEVGSNEGLRRTMVGNINRQIIEAHKSGNAEALVDLAGQRAALDQGGFEGLAAYQHKTAMERAQREQVGARTDALNAKSGGGEADLFSDPDKMYTYVLLKTKDPDLAEQAANRAALKRQSKSGGPIGVQVDPNQAATVLGSRYQSVAHLFGDNKGEPQYDLPQLFEQIKAVRPPGWDDPKSELGQAMAARIRSLYGAGLDKQLTLPGDPSGWATFGRLGFQQPIAPINWITHGFAGMTLDPQGLYDRRKAAADWYRRISGQ